MVELYLIRKRFCIRMRLSERERRRAERLQEVIQVTVNNMAEAPTKKKRYNIAEALDYVLDDDDHGEGQDSEASGIVTPYEPECEMSLLDLDPVAYDTMYDDAVKLVGDVNMILNSTNEVPMQEPSPPTSSIDFNIAYQRPNDTDALTDKIEAPDAVESADEVSDLDASNKELDPEYQPSTDEERNSLDECESDNETHEEIDNTLVDESPTASKSSRKRKHVSRRYKILDPCTCKKQCSTKISTDQRVAIFNSFWQIKNRDERVAWIFGMVNQREKLSCTSKASRKDRKFTREYKFIVNSVDIQVCKTYFLHTLGYKYDTILTKIFKPMTPSKIKPLPERRGKHKPKHAIDDAVLSTIDDHIESYRPSVSHYRREHAPLRRYLEPELNVRIMYGHFKSDHPEVSIGVNTYRRRLQAKNISFARLGEEECEVCEAIVHHACQGEVGNERMSHEERISIIQPGICKECDDWKAHIEKAKESREAYRRDADTYPADGEYCFSADMQKVMMLPRLPGNKTAVFTRRIVMYHETFAPLMPSKKVKTQWIKDKKDPPTQNLKPLGMLWHEGIQGRNDEVKISFRLERP